MSTTDTYEAIAIEQALQWRTLYSAVLASGGRNTKRLRAIDAEYKKVTGRHIRYRSWRVPPHARTRRRAVMTSKQADKNPQPRG